MGLLGGLGGSARGLLHAWEGLGEKGRGRGRNGKERKEENLDSTNHNLRRKVIRTN